MFNMYQQAYSSAGQPLWFQRSDEMFSSACSCVVHHNGGDIICFALFQLRPLCNKISLVAHNGTTEGSDYSLRIRNILCRQEGWYLESKDRPAWILRSRFKTPYVRSVEKIKEILDISASEDIELNPNFEPDVDYIVNHNTGLKREGYFFHVYYDSPMKLVVRYRNMETLFGTSPCNNWSSEQCQRSCLG